MENQSEETVDALRVEPSLLREFKDSHRVPPVLEKDVRMPLGYSHGLRKRVFDSECNEVIQDRCVRVSHACFSFEPLRPGIFAQVDTGVVVACLVDRSDEEAAVGRGWMPGYHGVFTKHIVLLLGNDRLVGDGRA